MGHSLMSKRKAAEWTDRVEDAFEDSSMAKKGREGELFVLDMFRKWGWETVDHENDQYKQSQGIDISFRNPKWRYFYTCDVKATMNERGAFTVWRHWLMKTRAHRIFHVNVSSGRVAWYDVVDMRNYYCDQTVTNVYRDGSGKLLHYIKVELEYPSIISTAEHHIV